MALRSGKAISGPGRRQAFRNGFLFGYPSAIGWRSAPWKRTHPSLSLYFGEDVTRKTLRKPERF
jgi:hypothetical protein